MYRKEYERGGFNCYGTNMFHNHAVPVQETEGRLEEFPYGYGASFDKDGQLRRLFYYGYPTGKLEHIQNYPEIVLRSNLEWRLCFDEKGKMIEDERVGEVSNSNLQDVCYGQNEFTRILEKEGKLENLRQTIFKMLTDEPEEEKLQIEKEQESDEENTGIKSALKACAQKTPSSMKAQRKKTPTKNTGRGKE